MITLFVIVITILRSAIEVTESMQRVSLNVYPVQKTIVERPMQDLVLILVNLVIEGAGIAAIWTALS